MRRRTASRFRIIGEPRIPRMRTMVFMFVVLCLLMYRAADPNTWGWLAQRPGPQGGPAEAAAAAPPTEAPAPEAAKEEPQPAKPAAKPTGPTDEDPDEKEAMNELRGLIMDRTRKIAPEEMLAYERVVRWVRNQPLEVLRQRAAKGMIYDQFISEPQDYRLKVVEIDLDARRVLKCDKPVEGGPVWDVFGFSSESRGWPYEAIIVDLPQGMPVGESVRARTRVVGYFFKIQSFKRAGAELNEPDREAPVIIGRLDWRPAAAQEDALSDWVWTALWVGVAAIGVVITAVVILRAARRRTFSAIPPTTIPSGHAVNDWLDGAGSDKLSSSSGNNFAGNGESTEGGTEHQWWKPADEG